MDVDHDKLTRRKLRRERYFLIEPDGELATYIAYNQRPAAERNARHRGYGVYDAKERKVVLEPNVALRVHELEGQIEYNQRKARDARAKHERFHAILTGQGTLKGAS